MFKQKFDLQKFDSVSYVDGNGETQTVDATPLTGSETTLSAGWYVVNNNITYSNTLNLNGDVKLILADGAELKIDNSGNTFGDAINEDNSSANLTVYGQTKQSGKLTVISDGNAVSFSKSLSKN